eukprot:1156916-Pelagomonas_calceolata.AAC.6
MEKPPEAHNDRPVGCQNRASRNNQYCVMVQKKKHHSHRKRLISGFMSESPSQDLRCWVKTSARAPGKVQAWPILLEALVVMVVKQCEDLCPKISQARGIEKK